ncbi:hypothetical protein OJF2_42220 [Aquisphaera giovannonii]|uniref:Uncharacterized protein n=1 Tax=Aquisphaera giovannonii TaxID=406548 RepID=A0A5B9W5S1_9BACT|nr:hypothetical protein [Aquisphaera giovannonii]QEH35667.1 hypothetical protein OJF2_42220 [Aquisphaera giovannonii]
MALITCLRCPHCGRDIRTKKIIAPGALVRCPGCDDVFRISPSQSGEHMILQETIPVGPPPRALPAFGALPPPLPSPAPASPTRSGPRTIGRTSYESRAKYREPFGHSRNTFAALGIACIALVGVGSGSWYFDQIRVLGRAANGPGSVSKKKQEELANGKVPGKPPAPPSLTITKPELDGDGRTTVPRTVKIGHLIVGVSHGSIGPLSLPSGKTAEQYLVLTLRVTNESEAPSPYKGWIDGRNAVLRDKFGNRYNPTPLRPDDRPSGCYDGGPIAPHVTATDLVVFEKPAMAQPYGRADAPANELELDLPLGSSAFRFRIPWMFLMQAMPNFEIRPANTAPQFGPAPAPSPYDPEADPALRDAVRRAYRDGTKAIDHAAKGMETNHGREYRRGESKVLIDRLVRRFKAHHLTREQIARIIDDVPAPHKAN